MHAHLGRAGAPALTALLLAGGVGGCSDFSVFPLRVPTDVVVADLDGDGRADVVTLAQLGISQGVVSGQLQVFRQAAPGLFAAPETYTVGTYPWRVHAVDVDGDGAPDLVLTDVGTWTVSWMRQDPSSPGRFLPPEPIDSGLHAYDVGVADLDGDGAPDLAIPDVRRGATRLVLRYQDPARRGTFLPGVDLATPGASGDLVCGDVDGDGRTDLLGWFYRDPIGYTPNGFLGVTLQAAGATWGPVSTVAAEANHVSERLAIGDVDGDGRKDLLAYLLPSSSASRPRLIAVRQTGPGSFADPVSTDLGRSCGVTGATFADLDGDGRTDVAVVGNQPESSLCVLTPSGGGTFEQAAIISLPVDVQAGVVGAGDLDGDRRPDLVVFGGEDPVLVLAQSSTSPGTFEPPRPLR